MSVDVNPPFCQIEIEWIPNLQESKPTNKELLSVLTFLRPSIDLYFNNFRSAEVKGLSPETIGEIRDPSRTWAITDKADGERKFIVRLEGPEVYQVGSSKIMELVPELKMVAIPPMTLLDSEKIDGTFWLFDLVFWNGTDMRLKHFEERYGLLYKQFGEARTAPIRLKKFCMAKTQQEQNTCLKSIWNNRSAYPYELDGIIFTPLGKPYIECSIKWEPPDMMTADLYLWREQGALCCLNDSRQVFRYLKPPRNITRPFEDYFGEAWKKSKVIPFYFDWRKPPTYQLRKSDLTPDEYKLWNNKTLLIIECLWSPNLNRWTLVRPRHDKDIMWQENLKVGRFVGPNKYLVVRSNMEGVINPITFQKLVG